LLILKELPAQMRDEPASLQVILAGVVAVERRSADMGGLTDVIDSNRVIALLPDQGHQRVLQRRPRAGGTAVNRASCHRNHLGPVTRSCRSGTFPSFRPQNRFWPPRSVILDPGPLDDEA